MPRENVPHIDRLEAMLITAIATAQEDAAFFRMMADKLLTASRQGDHEAIAQSAAFLSSYAEDVSTWYGQLYSRLPGVCAVGDAIRAEAGKSDIEPGNQPTH